MTLEQLVRIIVETVEQVLYLEKLQAGALIFQEENRPLAEEALRDIKEGSNIVLYGSGSLPTADLDILVLDTIPAEYLPKLALGLGDDPFSQYVNGLVLTGKKVMVLKKTEYPLLAPKGCITLLDAYWKMLASYGYMLPAGVGFKTSSPAGMLPVQSAGPPAVSRVYDKNVLSKTDLLEYAENGRIQVRESVLITDLARETAIKMKITIETV